MIKLEGIPRYLKTESWKPLFFMALTF